MGLFYKKLLTVFVVGQNQLTIAQGSNTKLDSCISTPIDWADEKKSAEQLSKFLVPAIRRQIGELCLVLPRSIFFTRFIHLPSVDPQEIHKMVSLQINQLLPYVPEQAVWDFVVCAERNSGTDVLVLAAQRQTLMKYLQIFSSAGCFPTVVTASSFALAALSSIVFSTGNTALFLADESSSEICFCDRAKFYSSRAISYGTKDFSNDQAQDFWVQIRLTFEAQRKGFSQYGVACGLYFLPSPDYFPPGFSEQLAKVSGIAWEEASIETCKKKIGQAYLSNQKVLSSDMLMAVSVLSRGIKNLGNFLPKNFKDRHNITARRRDAIVIMVLFLASVLSLTLAVSSPIIKKIQQINSLDEQLTKIRKPFLKLRKQKEIQSVIAQRLEKQFSPLGLVEELYRIVPDGVVFLKIQVSEENKVDLQGQALESSTVNDLQEKMTASNLFNDLRLEHTFRKPGPMGEVMHFSISANFLSTAPAKRE